MARIGDRWRYAVSRLHIQARATPLLHAGHLYSYVASGPGLTTAANPPSGSTKGQADLDTTTAPMSNGELVTGSVGNAYAGGHTGTIAVAVVEDGSTTVTYWTSGGGRGTGVAAFIAWPSIAAFLSASTWTLGNGSTPPGATTVAAPAGCIDKGGTYRIVLIVAPNVTVAGDATQYAAPPIATGLYHLSTDGEDRQNASSALQLTGVNPDQVSGWFRRGVRADTMAMVNPTNNARYGHSPALTFRLRPQNALTAGLILPTLLATGRIRAALTTTTGDVTPAFSSDHAVTGTGTQTTASFNVNNTWPATPTNYAVQLGLNNVLGLGSTTPTNQRPTVVQDTTQATGEPDGGPTIANSDLSWTFLASTDQTLASWRRANTTNVDKRIGSGIEIHADSGLTTPGQVLVFNETARTNINRLVTTNVAGVTPHGIAYLRAWIADAHGAALPSVVVTGRVFDKSGTAETTVATLQTDANGRIDWSHTAAASHATFNRFKYTNPDNPDSLGANDVAIPTADVHKPSGTKTGTYPDPCVPTTTRNFGAATFPARSKKVDVVGRVYGSGLDPATSQATDAFGVSGEVIFAGMWSGNSGDNTTTADGAPDGVVTRSKVTAAGSFFFKTSDKVNEAAFAVADLTRANPTDVAGRPFTSAAAFMVGRRGLFNRTTKAIVDGGSNLPAQEDLDAPLGYSVHGTPTQTFDSVAAPSDATTYAYYQGFSTSGAIRDTFQVVDVGDLEQAGFTTTSGGLFGYRQQIVDYNIIRDDLAIIARVDPGEAWPGADVVVTAKAIQVLPDLTTIDSSFDGPPQIYIFEGAPTDPLSVTVTAQMSAIAGSEDFNYTFTVPQNLTYSVLVLGKVAGSRPTPGRAQINGAGQNPDLVVMRGAGPLAGADDHFSHGDGLLVGCALLDRNTDTLVAADSADVILARFNTTTGLPESLDSADSETWVAIPDTVTVLDEFALSPSAGNAAVFIRTFTAAQTANWGDAFDSFPVFRMLKDGIVYYAPAILNVLGTGNLHSDTSGGGTAVDAVDLVMNRRITLR